jgi:hypothetical protein
VIGAVTFVRAMAEQTSGAVIDLADRIRQFVAGRSGARRE